MNLSQEKYRTLYELLWENPRLQIRSTAAQLGESERILRAQIEKALSQWYIVGPEARKKSYLNMQEFHYFIRSEEDADSKYLDYCEDPRIISLVRTLGHFDLWIASREEMDFEGDILVKGVRSDIYVSKPPVHSWADALKSMREKVDAFDYSYTQKGYIQTHWDETVEWSEEDELMYQYFKFNLRKRHHKLKDAHGISTFRIKEWFSTLPQNCTIFTIYFPESFPCYISYLFMFETDYEDFIIDLFSEIPTTSFFFKVSDKLFAQFYLPGQLEDDLSPGNKSDFHLFVSELSKKKILKTRKYAIPVYPWTGCL